MDFQLKRNGYIAVVQKEKGKFQGSVKTLDSEIIFDGGCYDSLAANMDKAIQEHVNNFAAGKTLHTLSA